MLNNFKVTVVDANNNYKEIEFSTNANTLAVGRVVNLVEKHKELLEMNPAQAVMDILKTLGHDVLDGVHYNETYTIRTQ